MMPMEFVEYFECGYCGSDHSIEIEVTASVGGPVFTFVPPEDCDECLREIDIVSLMKQIEDKWDTIHEDYEYKTDFNEDY